MEGNGKIFTHFTEPYIGLVISWSEEELSQFLKHIIMKVLNEPNDLQLIMYAHLINGSVEVGSASRKTTGVMVGKRIAMMDQMKTIVVSKNVQIKSLHDYQSFFM